MKNTKIPKYINNERINHAYVQVLEDLLLKIEGALAIRRSMSKDNMILEHKIANDSACLVGIERLIKNVNSKLVS